MSLTETVTYTYDQLVEPAQRPAFMTIEKHADFADNGVLMLWAPTVISGLVLKPGQQLNAEYDPAQVAIVSYSVGPVDGASGGDPADEPTEDDDGTDDEPAKKTTRRK